jgi:hypothetical protein
MEAALNADPLGLLQDEEARTSLNALFCAPLIEDVAWATNLRLSLWNPLNAKR